MEMYELKDPTAEQDLANAAKRGVKVRVLLDRDYSGAYENAAAYSYLQAHDVQVRWAPAHYIFHIKATSFDDRSLGRLDGEPDLRVLLEHARRRGHRLEPDAGQGDRADLRQ